MNNLVMEMYGHGPVQADGTIDGKPFYFRARDQHWSMSIGGNDVVGAPEWRCEEPYGDEAFDASWMPHGAALQLIGRAIERYEAELKLPPYASEPAEGP